MIQENEIVTLVLTAAVLAFFLLNRARLAAAPAARLYLAAFLVVLIGRVATVAEGFFLGEILNLLEHVSYAVGGILLALAVWTGCRCGGADR